MTIAYGIRSLAAALPGTLRTNLYWRNKYPDMVARAEEKTLARLFATSQPAAATSSTFDTEMQPFLADPFRGTVERRILAGRSTQSIELEAARAALAAAAMKPGDIDLLLDTALTPDQQGIGNATFLVRDLGLRCPGWNVESACSSALVALDTAGAFVRTGRYRNVLVVTSSSYSRDAEETDTLSWFMGDAASAFVVGPEQDGFGVLGQHTVNTAATCGTFYHDLIIDPEIGPKPRLTCTPATQRILRETSEGYVRSACEGALRAAHVSLADIKCFVFNTPTAWFRDFACRTLGVAPSRAVDTYPRYANVGPALTGVNMHEAATTGMMSKGDLVLVYSIGSVSTASAVVMRWGDVALGPVIPPPTDVGR